jgi:hypothetical protein
MISDAKRFVMMANLHSRGYETIPGVGAPAPPANPRGARWSEDLPFRWAEQQIEDFSSPDCLPNETGISKKQ